MIHNFTTHMIHNATRLTQPVGCASTHTLTLARAWESDRCATGMGGKGGASRAQQVREHAYGRVSVHSGGGDHIYHSIARRGLPENVCGHAHTHSGARVGARQVCSVTGVQDRSVRTGLSTQSQDRPVPGHVSVHSGGGGSYLYTRSRTSGEYA
jgi:hypothetical protein